MALLSVSINMLSAHFQIGYIEPQPDIQTKEKFDHAIFPDFNRS